MNDAFAYKGYTLFDALDALLAFDGGATDSGVSDEDMRAAVKAYLGGLDPDARRKTLAVFARRYIDDRAIEGGYGVEDVVRFAEWLEEQGGSA